jgi:hemolysin-activating ACP:hemolysin acyltransferase
MTNYTVDTLTYQLDQIEEGRIRIVVSLNEEVELGSLYFERAKKTFNRKPIGMNAWACVDAKVEGLYVYGGDNITPKDIVNKCQQLISSWSMR